MGQPRSRQRDKLIARAESMGATIASDVIAPLEAQLAALHLEVAALAKAAGELSRQADGADLQTRDRPRDLRSTREAPIVFLHVPKTAGTTLAIWMRLALGDLYSKCASYNLEPDKVRALAATLRQQPGLAEVVAGHLPYSTHALFPEGTRFFTFLRDPIERAMSHFYYFMEREENPVSLADALAGWSTASPLSQALLPDNLHTRMLSGFDADAPSSREMLDAAIRHLRTMDVVGITERFNESVALLHQAYGWPLLAIPSRRVRTHLRPSVHDLPAGDLDGLRRLNALDEELYAEGMRLFEAALEGGGAAVALEAEALRHARQADGERAEDPSVARRAAAIAADTAAALDADLPEQAHGIAVTILMHTAQVTEALDGHLPAIARLTREMAAVVRKQQSRA